MGPFLPGVHHVPFPHCFRQCSHARDEPCPIAAGDEIEKLFETIVPPENVAAIVVEPIQGEGGYVIPPAAFMPQLRRICDANGILLVADEVQSGFARSGRMFAVDHWGVVPDIMCVAKALGNGMPIGGIIAKRSVMSAWHPGEHGSTFGGNPVACAAALAVIDTIREEGLEERAVRLGAVVMERARGWQQRFHHLGDVRGLGMMIGLEFMEEGRSATAYTRRLRRIALSKNLLLLSCGVHDNVLRIIPPLTTPEGDLDAGLNILEEALAEAER
jgi:4-aminobutyrate aminotransferase-like enzyme